MWALSQKSHLKVKLLNQARYKVLWIKD
jgi:hypothetical protein